MAAMPAHSLDLAAIGVDFRRIAKATREFSHRKTGVCHKLTTVDKLADRCAYAGMSGTKALALGNCTFASTNVVHAKIAGLKLV
jgi:hypothetical protein